MIKDLLDNNQTEKIIEGLTECDVDNLIMSLIIDITYRENSNCSSYRDFHKELMKRLAIYAKVMSEGLLETMFE